jgi:hypothetical protein
MRKLDAHDFGKNKEPPRPDAGTPLLRRWVGPFRLREYLERSIDPKQEWPPEKPGVYVVSVDAWDSEPSALSRVLYVGANPGSPVRFRIRVGELVIAMLGLGKGGNHPGGQSIWGWCSDKGVPPLELYLGWLVGIECAGGNEAKLFTSLRPTLNENRPPGCRRINCSECWPNTQREGT